MFVILILCLSLVLAGMILVLWPPGLVTPSVVSAPAQTYDEALARIARLQALDDTTINPVCHTLLLSQGRRVERCIIFLHGYTNCPHQFRALGERFYALGYNVLIPRLPHHGLTDRMTDAQARLTAQELVDLLTQVVDLAHGLGEDITVAGISAGGVLAAYAAQFRRDVHLAVLIAPTFGVAPIPRRLFLPVRNLALRLPNRFIWWDAKTKNTTVGPQHAYPRFATRSTAEILRLAATVYQTARRQSPVTASVLVVTTTCDRAVDNTRTTALVNAWQARGFNGLKAFEFPVEAGLQHDLIDPAQPDAQVDVVYPLLIEMMTS